MKEIERKFLVTTVPMDLTQYDYTYISQGFLNTGSEPVLRIRNENGEYTITYKFMDKKDQQVKASNCVEEYNLKLTEEAFEHLKGKIDGQMITKRRYRIPMENGLIIELDVFEENNAGLIIAEVEFPDIESAEEFELLSWFDEEITKNKEYRNSVLALKKN